MEHEKKSVMFALVACVIWGTVYVAIKIGLSHGLKPLGFAGVRFLCGGLILLAVVWHKGFPRLTRHDLLILCGLGLLQTAIQNALFFYGVQQTNAGISAIFINTSPFFVMLLSPFFFKASKLTFARIIGAVIGFGGVAIAARHHAAISGSFVLGVIALTGSAFTWSLANIAVKKIIATRDTTLVTGIQMASGAVPLIFAGMLIEGMPFANADSTAMFTLLYLAVFATSLPFFAWYRALELGEVGRVSIFGFTLPVFGVLSGWLVLGEPMTPYIAVGMAMVAIGIVIVHVNIVGWIWD